MAGDSIYITKFEMMTAPRPFLGKNRWGLGNTSIKKSNSLFSK